MTVQIYMMVLTLHGAAQVLSALKAMSQIQFLFLEGLIPASVWLQIVPEQPFELELAKLAVV